MLFNGCGSGSNSSTDTQAFTQQNKTLIHDLFLSEYLWYDQVSSNVDYEAYTTPQEMINALRVTPPDIWSYTMTSQEYEDHANQTTSGFGFGITSGFIIYSVRIDAPAYGKLQRGDQILEINNTPITYERLIEASENIGHETLFTILRGVEELQIAVTANPYSFKVTLGQVIQQDSKNVGYLRYDSFTENSVNELETVFSHFKDMHIEELVIDLRYNGGGSLAVASTLLDNITNRYAGQRQVYLDWNPNYQHRNSAYYFEDIDMQDGNELDLNRVIFLVTQDSASASELVISALKPYLGDHNVITVGDFTHGKPVGMSGYVDGNNFYFLVNFFVRNTLGETTSFDGISPTCSAQDDLSYLRGDSREAMLSTALYYSTHNRCP